MGNIDEYFDDDEEVGNIELGAVAEEIEYEEEVGNDD